MTDLNSNAPAEQAAPEGTSDDKLWSAIGYPIAIVPIAMLLMEDKKNRGYIRYHAVQSLAANVIYIALTILVSTVTLGFGGICMPFLWIVFLYWGYQAYQGQKFEIPMLTDFLKKQGWI